MVRKCIELPIPQAIEYLSRVDNLATPGIPIIMGNLLPSELIFFAQFSTVLESKQNWLMIKKEASVLLAISFFNNKALLISLSEMSGLPSG